MKKERHRLVPLDLPRVSPSAEQLTEQNVEAVTTLEETTKLEVAMKQVGIITLLF